METVSRKMTVLESATNRKTVFESKASTLSELKSELSAHNINYDGMVFNEGLTGHILNSDDAILTKEVNYHGRTVTDSVIVLTNVNSKIKSGTLSRNEAYAIIKANKLEDAVKNAYGRNFTQVSTPSLCDIIKANETAVENIAKRAKAKKAQAKGSDNDIDEPCALANSKCRESEESKCLHMPDIMRYFERIACCVNSIIANTGCGVPYLDFLDEDEDDEEQTSAFRSNDTSSSESPFSDDELMDIMNSVR